MATVLAASSVLLVVTGFVKVARPAAAATAVGSLGLPFAGGQLWTGRALGIVESGVGGAGLLAPSPFGPGLVALAYLGFGGFVVFALRPGRDVASCGCAGHADTPPTATHLVVNVLFAAAATVAAVTGSVPLLWRLGSVASTLAAAAALLVTYLGWLSITAMPRLTAARLALR